MHFKLEVLVLSLSHSCWKSCYKPPVRSFISFSPVSLWGSAVSIGVSGNGVMLKDSVPGSPLPRPLCTAVQIRREMH